MLLGGLMAGCTTTTTPTLDLSQATIVDVRTPAEYADGHLEGAINIDIQASDFTAQIEALPKDTEYYVYCLSGVRATSAARLMVSAGLDTVNLGGVQDASKATGIPIVT